LPKNTLRVRGDGSIHLIDLNKLVSFLNESDDRAIDLYALAMRLEYYPPHDFVSSLFQPDRLNNAPIFGPEYLVINVRGAEILGDFHVDYMPTPIFFLRELVFSTGLSPVFVGQLGNDTYSQKIRHVFPEARFLPSTSVAVDFEIIRRASNLVISVSSFSWLGGWLSNAKTIHMPLLGLLNPLQRPDVDLIPRGDKRYRIYEFPVRKWHATEEDLDYILNDHGPYPVTSAAL
jgi:hypothetical protein